jgi:hypothetical protein
MAAFGAVENYSIFVKAIVALEKLDNDTPSLTPIK